MHTLTAICGYVYNPPKMNQTDIKQHWTDGKDVILQGIKPKWWVGGQRFSIRNLDELKSNGTVQIRLYEFRSIGQRYPSSTIIEL